MRPVNGLENPWQRLPRQGRFVLPEDAEPIARFASRASEDFRLHLDLLPEPFLGNPDAPVVLLGLNPGYSPDDLAHHRDPAFAERSWDNLLHRPAEHPFYLLDPAIAAPGRRWWEQRLGPLIRRVGLPAVTRGVLCVEYFPYHSVKFGHGRLALPSQQYSFELVRHAVARDAAIVVLRGKKLWLAAVPALAAHPRLYGLNSAQNVTVSPANCPAGFAHLVSALVPSAAIG